MGTLMVDIFSSSRNGLWPYPGSSQTAALVTIPDKPRSASSGDDVAALTKSWPGLTRPSIPMPQRTSVAIKASANTKSLHYDLCPLGYWKIESTVRYLGIEVDDAIEIAEKIEI